MNDDDVHMLASIPANDDDWKSVNLGAKLSTLCGSTKITAPPSSFAAHWCWITAFCAL